MIREADMRASNARGGKLELVNRDREMAAYDALPAEMRRAIDDAWFEWIPSQVAGLLTRFPPAKVVDIIRANDVKRARAA